MSPIRAHHPLANNWYHRPSIGLHVATYLPTLLVVQRVMSPPLYGGESHITVYAPLVFLAVSYFTVESLALPGSLDHMMTIMACSIPKWQYLGKGLDWEKGEWFPACQCTYERWTPSLKHDLILSWKNGPGKHQMLLWYRQIEKHHLQFHLPQGPFHGYFDSEN